jgi:hypothetical protein
MNDQRWRAPYFWAGFVFQGEYENRIAANKNSSPNLVLMVATPLFLILAGLMLYLRQRQNASSYPLKKR